MDGMPNLPDNDIKTAASTLTTIFEDALRKAPELTMFSSAIQSLEHFSFNRVDVAENLNVGECFISDKSIVFRTDNATIYWNNIQVEFFNIDYHHLQDDKKDSNSKDLFLRVGCYKGEVEYIKYFKKVHFSDGSTGTEEFEPMKIKDRIIVLDIEGVNKFNRKDNFMRIREEDAFLQIKLKSDEGQRRIVSTMYRLKIEDAKSLYAEYVYDMLMRTAPIISTGYFSEELGYSYPERLILRNSELEAELNVEIICTDYLKLHQIDIKWVEGKSISLRGDQIQSLRISDDDEDNLRFLVLIPNTPRLCILGTFDGQLLVNVENFYLDWIN